MHTPRGRGEEHNSSVTCVKLASIFFFKYYSSHSAISVYLPAPRANDLNSFIITRAYVHGPPHHSLSLFLSVATHNMCPYMHKSILCSTTEYMLHTDSYYFYITIYTNKSDKVVVAYITTTHIIIIIVLNSVIMLLCGCPDLRVPFP